MNRVGRAGIVILCLNILCATHAEQPHQISVDWRKILGKSTLSPSVYVVTSPMMRPNSPIHAPVNAALKTLGADYLRFMVYDGHPQLSIPALYAPKDGKTSWDFSLMDPLMMDFFKITQDHPAIL